MNLRISRTCWSQSQKMKQPSMKKMSVIPRSRRVWVYWNNICIVIQEDKVIRNLKSWMTSKLPSNACNVWRKMKSLSQWRSNSNWLKRRLRAGRIKREDSNKNWNLPRLIVLDFSKKLISWRMMRFKVSLYHKVKPVIMIFRNDWDTRIEVELQIHAGGSLRILAEHHQGNWITLAQLLIQLARWREHGWSA